MRVRAASGVGAIDDRAGLHLLQSVDDDALARMQARRHDALAADFLAQRDFAECGLVVLPDDEDEALALVVADRHLPHKDHLAVTRARQPAPTRTCRAPALPSALAKRARARIVPVPVSILLSKLSIVPLIGVAGIALHRQLDGNFLFLRGGRGMRAHGLADRSARPRRNRHRCRHWTRSLVSSGASARVCTRLPTVISARLTRPAIGALT